MEDNTQHGYCVIRSTIFSSITSPKSKACRRRLTNSNVHETQPEVSPNEEKERRWERYDERRPKHTPNSHGHLRQHPIRLKVRPTCFGEKPRRLGDENKRQQQGRSSWHGCHQSVVPPGAPGSNPAPTEIIAKQYPGRSCRENGADHPEAVCVIQMHASFTANWEQCDLRRQAAVSTRSYSLPQLGTETD